MPTLAGVMRHAPARPASRVPAIGLLFVVSFTPAAGQIPGVSDVCADRPAATGESLFTAVQASNLDRSLARPASDLHCIDLFATARGGPAVGVVELRTPWSPFGVSVTAEGHHRNTLIAWFSNLPDPAEFGPYSTYVAWATPLELEPVVRLGEVEDGRNELGEVAFNKYLIWVTAEASAGVTVRSGPLILRGRSPSSRMEAHDLMALAPSAETGGAHHEAGHTTPDTGWSLPPAYPEVPMLPGVMRSRPRVSPLRPLPPTDELPEAAERTIVELPDGGTLDLTADWVRKTVGAHDLVMMAFNGQIPGPLIRVSEASTIFVNFENRTSMPTAVHWHGLRLDNRYDGVPGVTQDPVQPGESFRYQVHFPDPGIYWYHPHHREDVQQELGLAGNMLVTAADPDYYGPVTREEVVMLDDLLLSEDGVVPFGEESANYMLMGRFGNTFLTNGEPHYELDVEAGDVVRFHFTNVSNTRTFNLSFRALDDPDAQPLPMKAVASDVSRFERETMVENAVLAPAERYVLEVRFPRGGAWALTNHVQGINHRQGLFLAERTALGTVTVSATAARHESVVEAHAHAFETLRENADVIADMSRYREHFDRAPDHELVLTLDVEDLPMAIEQSMNLDWVYFNPVEWTGTMPVMNWATTGAEVRWILRDPATGAENTDIAWRFRVGDVVKIRVTNDRSAFHAMQHPLHIHGQRFLVLARNGVPLPNRAWKDTVLLPTGSTTDILLELSNPGRWMVHCHIAEHLESGMKFVFDVEGS